MEQFKSSSIGAVEAAKIKGGAVDWAAWSRAFQRYVDFVKVNPDKAGDTAAYEAHLATLDC
ncbi:MAG: hypothetical protein ACPGRW_09090 [Flavobacteriaceae bacterium]